MAMGNWQRVIPNFLAKLFLCPTITERSGYEATVNNIAQYRHRSTIFDTSLPADNLYAFEDNSAASVYVSISQCQYTCTEYNFYTFEENAYIKELPSVYVVYCSMYCLVHHSSIT